MNRGFMSCAAFLAVGLFHLVIASAVGERAGDPGPSPGRPESAGAGVGKKTPPTLANVRYGLHERQMLDFWRASSTAPTPVVFHIHGGGWVGGDKARVANLERYLAAGISVVSINYRFVTDAIIGGAKPPVQWPLQDAARALQFIRTMASEWNIDPVRIGATGSSAGACSSLWLAFHADMAEAGSEDPVARQSTRLWCVAVVSAQTSLDPKQMKDWTPNSRYGGHAFGFMPDPRNAKTRDTMFPQFLAARGNLMPWIREYSPFEHVSADDPEVYLAYSTPPAMGQNEKDPTHSANFGKGLVARLREMAVPCELVYPGAVNVRHDQVDQFLISKLKTTN